MDFVKPLHIASMAMLEIVLGLEPRPVSKIRRHLGNTSHDPKSALLCEYCALVPTNHGEDLTAESSIYSLVMRIL